MSTAPHKREGTTWSPGLIGFYAGCATVSIGAAIAASGLIVFGNKTALSVGLVMVVGGAIACWRCLHAARRSDRSA